MRRIICAGSAALVAAMLAGCGDGGEDQVAAPTTNELGPIHVHGLGVNPADGALFVATHTGMFRIAEDQDEAVRVGDSYQDTMGFTVAGPDRFLGSGHPDLRDDLPPYLGLIESVDGGGEWKPVSLLGQADFHVLESEGDRVYGFGSDFETREEQFLVSRDRGREWEEASLPEPMLSLAINPADPDELLMSGNRTLYRSTDAGANWQPVAGEPGLIGWPEPERLVLVTLDGAVATAGVAGKWQSAGDIGGEPAAFEAEPGRLFVALHDGAIKESTDDGQTWSTRSVP